MAKKKVEETVEEAIIEGGSDPVPPFAEGKPIVQAADLQTARVCVTDGNGNYFFLSPSIRSGEYILRPIPNA